MAGFEDKAIGEPLIWEFGLRAIHEFLTEETVFVSDGVAM
jgi:hypothetical protein